MKKHKYIFGQKVEYKLKDFSKDNMYIHGLYEPHEKCIYIDKKLKGNDLKQTILHEEIHAIFDRCGMNQTHHTQDLQEMVCENISIFLIEHYKISEK